MDFLEEINATLEQLANAQSHLALEDSEQDLTIIGGSIMSGSELLSRTAEQVQSYIDEIELLNKRNRELQTLNNELSRKIYIKAEQQREVDETISLAQEINRSIMGGF